VKINETSLNVDTLIGSKVDCKVASLVFAEVLILERVELLAEKVNTSEVDKLYHVRERIK
jgi:hypothetical protein